MGKIRLIIGPMFSAKCVAPDTLVRKCSSKDSRGHVEISAGDIIPGDYLVGGDLTPRRVVSIIRGIAPMFEVRYESGQSFEANFDHILVLSSGETTTVGAAIGLERLSGPIWRYGMVHNVPFAVRRISAEGIRAPFVGFTLDGDGTFVLANGIITHNTSTMCAEVERHCLRKRRCIIVKHSADSRFDTIGIMNHRGEEYGLRGALLQAEIVQCPTLSCVDPSRADVIGIDEAQFFPDLVEHAVAWANAGLIVICAGLDADFARKPFGQICDLVPHAEEVVKLKAVCMDCGNDASFSVRTSSCTEQMEIGGADKYVAMCRECVCKKEREGTHLALL